jgi:hypothetical protein
MLNRDKDAQTFLEDVLIRAETIGALEHPADAVEELHKFMRSFVRDSAPIKGRYHLGMRQDLVAIASVCLRAAIDGGITTQELAVAMDDRNA